MGTNCREHGKTSAPSGVTGASDTTSPLSIEEDADVTTENPTPADPPADQPAADISIDAGGPYSRQSPPRPALFVDLAMEDFDVDEYRRNEERQREEARQALAGWLHLKGVSRAAINEVLPVLAEGMTPRMERMSGVLDDSGLLHPLYAFANPWGRDTEAPGWDEYEAVYKAAQERYRSYVMLRLHTPWIEDEAPEEGAESPTVEEETG
jgi:hypothetical protein